MSRLYNEQIAAVMEPERKESMEDGDSKPVGPGADTQARKDRLFRDLYSRPPDFKDLARRDADFAAVAKGRELDFCDPRAVMQLTKTLLKLDFGLTVELPEDRLCPPVPNRHNYILWLKDLLDSSSYSADAAGRRLLGVDIGTGASCIYPLLGCAQRPWSFIATDTDAESLGHARRNVERNGLGHRIRVVSRGPEDALVPLDDVGVDAADFVMTNPPFYGSDEEMLRSARQKARPPSSACTGAAAEMVTAGGEVGFVGRLLDESLRLRGRVQWYSAMLGFLASVTRLVGRLREHGIGNYAVTELVQGGRTRRWAVAWSFGPLRPAQRVARGTRAGPSRPSMLPAATEAVAARVPVPPSVGALAAALSAAVGALELESWDWDAQALEGTGRAPAKVWGRAWRRRKKREGEGHGTAPAETTCAMGFRVKMDVGVDHVAVRCRWIEGSDASLFESFQGFLKAAAQAASREQQHE